MTEYRELAGTSGSPLQHFDVDLDLPPRQRWKEVARVYREHIVGVAEQLKKYTAQYFEEGFREDFVSSAHWDKYPDQVEEMEGIVGEVNHPEVTLDVLKQWNMVYEMAYSPGCFAVLLVQPNGTVVHGRNMDYSIPVQIGDKKLNGQDMTFHATMYKDKKRLFIATSWPGHVGVHTGMRFDGWAIEQQTRLGMYTARGSLATGKQGGVPFLPEVRRALETVADFKTAVNAIDSFPFMAPQYLIMSGPGPYEGCVLSLDTLGKREPGTPAIQWISEKTRYLVQGNHDVDKFAKFNKLLVDPRRWWARRVLGREGVAAETCDATQLMDFMHTQPVFTPFNLFSTVMIPATGYYETVLPNETPTKNSKFWKGYLASHVLLVLTILVGVLCFAVSIRRRMSLKRARKLI